MNIDTIDHEDHRRWVEGATDPIELSVRALAALLLLAGMSPLRRRALPAHPLKAHSGLSNGRFQGRST